MKRLEDVVGEPDKIVLDKTAIVIWVATILAIVVAVVCFIMGRPIIGAVCTVLAIVIVVIAWFTSGKEIRKALKRS